MLEIETNFFSQWLQQQKIAVCLFGWLLDVAIFSVQLVLHPVILYWDELHGLCESAGGYIWNNNGMWPFLQKGKKKIQNIVKRWLCKKV